jgi:hypothetical protein
MANSELSVNDQIAVAFREINTDWRVFDHVSSENTEAILRKKALRPDILILEPGVPLSASKLSSSRRTVSRPMRLVGWARSPRRPAG